MTDKERLEEMAYNVGVSIDGEKAIMSSDDYDFLYNYALQQAERVQELEATVDFYQSALRNADRRVKELEDFKRNAEQLYKNYHLSAKKSVAEKEELEQQNKRYREALEFYADENNYREQELKGIVPPRPITIKPILHDYGSIARQALEGEK